MIESESTRRLGESGAIHLPQAAFADLGGDVIGAEGGARLEWHGGFRPRFSFVSAA